MLRSKGKSYLLVCIQPYCFIVVVRLSQATEPLHWTSLSSPASFTDRSREQLVKRDKALSWVLSFSNLPCTAHPSAERTPIEVWEAESGLKKTNSLYVYSPVQNWWLGGVYTLFWLYSESSMHHFVFISQKQCLSCRTMHQSCSFSLMKHKVRIPSI